LEERWRADVRAANVSDLLKETDLLRVLYLAKKQASPDEPPLLIAAAPELTLALLRNARSDATIQAMDSRAIRRSPRLTWDVLIEVCGSEEALRTRLDHVRTAVPGDDDLFQLADRYSKGWRPDR
jgi:hypothetical protein